MKWYLYMLCWMIYAYHVVIFHRHFFTVVLCILIQMYLSVHKFCNSIPKNSLTVWKIKISAYLDTDTKIMHVIIYKISIISSCYWNLLWTTITCTRISTLVKFCIYKWNKDLQQFSTEKWLYECWNISTILSHALSSPPPSSLIHNFLHSKRVHKVIWHNTYIYILYI